MKNYYDYPPVHLEDDPNDDFLDQSNNINSIKYKINNKRVFYSDLLENILRECRDEKEKLDMYYNYLQRWHTVIQSSVIIVSTASTFLQTFTQSLFITNNDNNDNELVDNNFNNSLNNSNKDYNNNFSFISILTLCVSTYSGLILSLAKFSKLDEKKENIHNLRERFAELHNKILHLLDLLKPWSNADYFEDLTYDKIKKWANIVSIIEVQYLDIIDVKQNLFMEFEKFIDSIIREHYNSQHLKFKKKQSEISYKITEHDMKKDTNKKRVKHEHLAQVKQLNKE